MIAGVGLLCSAPALAKEGADQYPNGVAGYAAGQLPPPGTYLLNYLGYYSGKVQDPDGNEVQIGGEPIEIDLWYEVPRLVHVSNKAALGGNVFFHALLPILKVEGSLGNILDDDVSGIGDLNAGIGLTWHKEQAHYAIGIDVYAPTGSFEASRPFNPGANYWSFEPVIAATWLSPDGWEASAKAMLNIKLENSDTDYQSGNEIKIDYHVGKRTEKFDIGIGGYYVNQISEDEATGLALPGTDGMTFAAGPQVKFNIGPAPVVVNWQKELSSKSRTRGSKFLIQIAYRF